MSRRRPASGATISLFPFLAVLLCTMGALLVLLVIFSRRAREAEVAADREAERARVEELQAARDDLRWRLEQLQGIRRRTDEDLARERMRLAGVEEDARTLADEIESLERTAEELERGADGPADDGIATAERRLAAARAALDEARAEGANKPAAYAVVPYEGANGTHRRPLYVECCLDGVFLQPEGIRLGPADFEGPPGPGNPLASALRAAREHLARGPDERGVPAAQPYPLLLVRPSGVMAYYAAREALVSWGSEFGYQFVDEDWNLTYPPADPALAAVEQRAVDESRRRLEWLAQMRPARPARPTRQYRAAPTTGGVVADGGPSVLGDQSRFDWTEEQAASARGAAGGSRGGAAVGGGDAVLGGGGSSGATGDAGGSPGPGPGDRFAGPSRFYSGEPPAGAAPSSLAGGTNGPDAIGAGSPTDGAARAGTAGHVAGQVGSAPATGGGSAAFTGDGGSASAAGGAGGSGEAAGMSGGGTGSTSGPALPGMAQSVACPAGGGGAGAASGSLAGSRGSNWASLATASRPIPVTRPIRVECAANEFRIFDDSGARVETRVPIGTRTADAVDPLVRAIHARVGRWGLAGERMYWRPELVLAETADGRSRRDDLERLLADSGLDTRRERPDPAVRHLPPVTRAGNAPPRR